MAAKLLAPCFVVLLFLSFLVIYVSAMPSKRRGFFSTIKELNLKGPYIGLITVYSPEEKAFFGTAVFKPDAKHPFLDLSGRKYGVEGRRYRVGKIYGKEVIYVRCGVGMVNAAAVTQQMLDLFDINGIVHFGISLQFE
ncbi:unnamed protein product [Dovyalis caffra]|uniref:Nucleoside phosphorylase domain-containing protein n=1 Tax=Dovyalis caffra TaxID=77055 RepID=A0AAV1QXR8_9ROSI|nr:unnamed protein product [Dovyalis caffra]